MKKIKNNRIPGGKAHGMTLKDFSKAEQRQIKIGTKIEMEHTNNKLVAREIAMDHVAEFSNYYTALRKMENKLKKQQRKGRK